VEIARVVLAAPGDALGLLEAFYGRALGLPVAREGERLAVHVGDGRIELVPDAPAFYHVAFLVARERFADAHAWLGERAPLLPHAESPSTVFDFPAWDAQACYCLDPAGNILELIGHPEAHGGAGPFGPDDLLAISEVGLVTPDPVAGAEALERGLGLRVWSGDPRSLGFVGRKAHTLILSPSGRGWLPTGRPAEPHPVEVELRGAGPGEVRLPGAPHVVRGLG
jgi:hypothetical protein